MLQKRMTKEKKCCKLRVDNFAKKEVLPMTNQELAKLAEQAKEFAYSPYYKFRVGAAIVTKGGNVYTGCNIETGAGFSICAERVAACKAIANGEKEFVSVAVTTDVSNFVTPCGVCRQFLSEFSPNMNVITYNGKTTKTYKLSALLPYGFKL